MKVLLRNYKGEPYVWKKAKMKDISRFILEDGNTVSQSGIVSISRDNRKRFVICSACGQVVKNEPDAIREHKERASTSATCFGCTELRESGSKQLYAKHTLQEDGSYDVSTKKNVKLVCRYRYRSFDINSQDARDTCRYKICATAEMRDIVDFFTRYPEAFDNIITVDKILDNGFTERISRTYQNEVHYKLKARNNITAIVNSLNIVDRFEIAYRNKTYNVVYSKKYDKLFVLAGGTYRNFELVSDIPDETIRRIKEKIASLYN